MTMPILNRKPLFDAVRTLIGRGFTQDEVHTLDRAIDAALRGSGAPRRLGALSEIYESGGRGPGTVSNGRGDPGGVSYGLYQLSSTKGSVAAFLRGEGAGWARVLRKGAPGSAAFSAAWRTVATRDEDAFAAAQHAFIERTHYRPVVAAVRDRTGLDIDTRHDAVRDAAWSVAVQHGGAAGILSDAVARADAARGRGDRGYDRMLVEAIYAVRSAYVLKVAARSTGASRRTLEGLTRTRYPQERAAALPCSTTGQRPADRISLARRDAIAFAAGHDEGDHMRTFFYLATAGLALSAASVAAATPKETAQAALRAAPVWDGHNDVPGQLRDRYGNVIAGFDFTDTTDTATPAQGEADAVAAMHTDLQRLRQGRVGAQFWSVYVPATLKEPEAVQTTIEQIDVTRRLIARYPADMELALTSADVARALKAGRIASLLGMEGGHSIGSSLAVLRQMYAMGARYMTLTHSRNTPWADSATDAPAHGGLTDFGRDVVREMNRIGMIVDLSHVSEETMIDALDTARAPVIFSHSGARGVNGHARNVPDAVLARLKANGGIVMVVGLPGYLSEAARTWSTSRTGEEARLKALWQGQPDKVAAALAAWDQANPEPRATVSDMADHVDRVRQLAGIDHIGIGGDYDGMPTGPVGMEDVRGYPVLFAELARRGYSQADLEKIASRNMMRVMRGVEAYAAARRGDPPVENRVAPW